MKYDIGLTDITAEDIHIPGDPVHDDSEDLKDFTRLYPPPVAAPEQKSKYLEFLKVAGEQINDIQMRLHGPLRRAGQIAQSGLPPINASKDSIKAKGSFGETGPSQEDQEAAAVRLMRGYSSRSSQADKLENRIKATPPPPTEVPQKKCYGELYRQRIEGLRRKPTVRLAQITLGTFNNNTQW